MVHGIPDEGGKDRCEERARVDLETAAVEIEPEVRGETLHFPWSCKGRKGDPGGLIRREVLELPRELDQRLDGLSCALLLRDELPEPGVFAQVLGILEETDEDRQLVEDVVPDHRDEVPEFPPGEVPDEELEEGVAFTGDVCSHDHGPVHPG